ncbi:uncharacterized protein zmp:0000000991 isoform X2 [Megalobrama amblycephala]|uniref:uncharacterized protein zmp:0000000991 isoform X2 n=1 Tax=Megalobrama amblycephala TaxID=75352 RepID=UPI002013F343|nr:uncharacterized protein zmp:0000000991 isoform X2 [Megalobrama amblycephala]XP_048030620.1 uncharacterized protein zmp:0000000991 isoform X2 [Megalobrama amblycephala]XP_048030621.1 uncharacterized protein zmp:0000000991 isoform X2 [Megalobrama amblycephala]XP_048030622.1 uncharacterized protein zmp:0000000991 isoform X2 [Megalobrama amblycephala]
MTCRVKDTIPSWLTPPRMYDGPLKPSGFQNGREQEMLHPGPSAQHIHNKKDLETSTTASSPALPLTGLQKSTKNLQIKQIILLRSKKDSSRTSEEQTKSARFTSTISISLPNRRHKKDTTEEKTLQGTTNLNNTLEVVKNTANQHNTELRDVFSPTEKCGKSTGELFKDEDGPKATFDGDSFTTLHQHVHNTPKQGQNTGIQQNIGLYEQTQIIHDSQRHSTQPVCEVETEVIKDFGSNDCRENAPTSPQYHSNLTSIGVDSGLKASTDSHLFACHAEVLNQVLSLSSFTAPDSENTSEPEPSLFNPSSAMLTSALASVLAPPWSGRLRRPKQGSNDVEHVPQDCGQNVNTSSLFRQDRQQSLFLPSQRQPSEHILANNNEMLSTAGTGFNSPDWQKENNSPNVTTTVQPKRPILKSSSVSTMYNNTELHPFSTPMDTHQVPISGYRISQTEDEYEPFKSLSSKPTTSSLLLSLRRTNLRNSSAESTQTQTPITRSVRSLTMPSRIVLKTQSFAQTVTGEDQTAKYPDTPTRTEEIPVSQFPFSPRIKSREPLRTPLFLNKPETEISKRLEASVARAEEELFPQSTTKTGQIGVKAQQSSYSVLLRKYSSTEDINPVEKSTVKDTNLQNFSITKPKITAHTTISPKDSTNFNVQQSDFNVQNIISQSSQNITARNSSGTSTFTDSLNYSPRKDSSVDEISPASVGQIYLDSKKHSQSSQSSMDLSSPLSPSRPLRSVRVPSIYSYLRESSPAVSTPFPSTPSPHIQRPETLPPKQDGGITLQGDQKTFPSRFSFDNPFVPEVQALQRSSYGSSTHIAPAQSLPPDFGRGSAPRLSTSPYSSLISSRPALNNTSQGLSSPPASKTHSRSTSYDIVTTQADHIKGDPSSSLSTYTRITRRSKEQLASPNREQRTAVQAYTSTLDNHRPAQPCLSQTSPDASFVMESQSAKINPHPRQPNTGSNNFPCQEHDGLTALQDDKGNAYPKQRLSEKEKYLLHNKLTVKSETPLTAEKETTAVHNHERLQEMQSRNSKKGLFASRVKKDNAFSSASLPDKEVVSPQYLKTKRHSPEFKTSSRIDQILNRLKLTFGVKRSDSTLDTITKKYKSPTQQLSDTETFEKSKTEEKTYSGSQRELSNSALTIDKASFCSLPPLTLKKSENTLNMDSQSSSTTEQKSSGCTWEAPNSNLITDKADFASFGSLSPLTLKKSENILNMDWQNRSTTEQKTSGCTWEVPNSHLTTDKTYFASFGSLSPLTLKKSENTLNMDWQNRSTTEQKTSRCTWEAPNSNLTTDKTYFASFRSLSPLNLKKSSENVGQLKRHSDETGKWSYSRSSSPHRLKAQSMIRSATLPHYKKSPVGPPSPFYLFDFDSEDIQNDNVFYSPVSKKTNSLCESEDFSLLSSTKRAAQQNLVRSRLSSSCADLKYGLHNGRSYSVSSVVSSRPSGPGRISTSSISDLSSLDDFAPKENYTFDSPVSSNYSPSYDPKSVCDKQSQSGYTDNLLDNDDADPTPPPSPTLSSSPRRISQAPAMSSLMRTTSENLSPPRGILPSRSYTTSLTVFEESGSDTTTDDEYYVDNGDEDEVETEL